MHVTLSKFEAIKRTFHFPFLSFIFFYIYIVESVIRATVTLQTPSETEVRIYGTEITVLSTQNLCNAMNLLKPLKLLK